MHEDFLIDKGPLWPEVSDALARAYDGFVSITLSILYSKVAYSTSLTRIYSNSKLKLRRL